jgi:hypothetical protein
MAEEAAGRSRRWALCCDCGHEAMGQDPAEAAANAQAHALEAHGLVIPAGLLLSTSGDLRKREEGQR